MKDELIKALEPVVPVEQRNEVARTVLRFLTKRGKPSYGNMEFAHSPQHGVSVGVAIDDNNVYFACSMVNREVPEEHVRAAVTVNGRQFDLKQHTRGDQFVRQSACRRISSRLRAKMQHNHACIPFTYIYESADCLHGENAADALDIMRRFRPIFQERIATLHDMTRDEIAEGTEIAFGKMLGKWNEFA